MTEYRKDKEMKKKLVALFLVLVLALTCFTACGDKDKDEKKKAKTYDDVYEMLGAMSEFQKGTATMSCDIDMGQRGNAKLTLTLVTDGKGNCKVSGAVDMDTEEVKLNAEVDDLVIIYDKMLYINLGGILKAATSYEPEIGEMLGDLKLSYFAVPLPDDLDTSKTTEVIQDSMELFTKFLKKGLKDAKVDGEDNEFSIALKDAAAYRTFFGEAANFMEGDIADYCAKKMETVQTSSIDMNAYVQKLINYYYNDIVELAGALNVEKTQIDSVLDELKQMDLNEKIGEAASGVLGSEMDADTIKEEMKKAADQLRTSMEKVSDEDFEKYETKVTVKTTDSGFKLKASFEGTADEGNSLKADVTIKISEEFDKISAPGEITRLGDFKDLVKQLGGLIIGGVNSYNPDDYEDWDD